MDAESAYNIPTPKSLEEALALLQNSETTAIDLCEISSKTAFDAIAAACPASNVQKLILPSQTHNDGVLDAMIDALPHMQLKSLTFEGGYLYEGVVCALAKKLPDTQISHLDVKAHQGLQQKGMCDLIDALSDTAIDHLEISSSHLSNDEAQKLSKQLAYGKITNLRLDCTLIEPVLETSFLSSIGQSSLETFHLKTSGLHSPGAEALAQSLIKAPITDFSLESSAMLADTAEILIETLPQTDITHLQMNSFRLAQPSSIAALTINLPYSKIEHLDITTGQPPSSNMSAFLEAIPHSQLRSLDMRSFAFDEASTQTFANILPKSGLHTLLFTPTLEATKALAQALPASQIASLNITSELSKHIAMEDLIAAIPQSNVTNIAMNKLVITENIAACLEGAKGNHEHFSPLAHAVLTAPESLTQEDWRNALTHTGALHQYGLEASPQATIAQIDTQLADSFLTIAQSDPQTCKTALLKLLPFNDAKHRLAEAGVPLEQKDIMDEAGNINEGFFCRGGTLALMGDMSLWNDSNQYRTAYRSLPEELKPIIDNLHQVCTVLDRQHNGTQRGR